ncbi:VanZ family protein [Citricoccus parietis]|uniref:VanZ family protein n=2 Tax=Citricoccus parietis TaxID=592307 RepID=A0ABV6F261_9MICC
MTALQGSPVSRRNVTSENEQVSAPPRKEHRRWAGWSLLAYLVPLTALVLSARLGDHGIPQVAESLLQWFRETRWFSEIRFGHLEAAANVLLFIPIGFLFAGLWGRRTRTPRILRSGLPDFVVWLLAVLLSAGIELTQMFLLAERSGTFRDLLCNATGALAGVLTFRLVQTARSRTSRRNTP